MKKMMTKMMVTMMMMMVMPTPTDFCKSSLVLERGRRTGGGELYAFAPTIQSLFAIIHSFFSISISFSDIGNGEDGFRRKRGALLVLGCGGSAGLG